MENKKISEMRAGDSVQTFFLIKSVESKTSNNNKRYLDLTLADQSGEINAKLWDCRPEDEGQFRQQTLVKVKGAIFEWQGRLQLKIEKIRLSAPEDGLGIAEFVPVAPREAEGMYQELQQYINSIQNGDLHKIVSTIIENKKNKLLIYPAAKQNHHAVRSGLLFHILTMLQLGEKITQVYPKLNRDLLYAGVILHDIAKMDEMKAGELGIVSEYTTEGELLGHIVQGIKLIDQTAKRTGADEEASLLLQHMILSHHYEPEFGSPKRPMIPEAEVLHYLDIIDARMYDMNKVLDNTKAGGFSDRVWLLQNRKLYKASFSENEKPAQEHNK